MKRVFLLAAVGVLLAILAAYSNHFQNDFQFDDGHSVTTNPAIRSLANIPRFFTDASTFSSMLIFYTYRPVVTTSLAFDYWLGGGLKPFYFHLTTFIIYLAGLAAMYWLFLRVFECTLPHPWNPFLALYASALFGLHPASAQTVNYIIQRGDLYATWAIVASVAMYAGLPKWRRFGLYLIPAAIGILSKPTALVIGPILLAYIFLFEDRGNDPGSRWKASIPALVLSVAGGILNKVMTSVFFDPHGGSAVNYWMTEPWVSLRYFRSFFAPFYLSGDSELKPFQSLNMQAIIGMLFIAVMIALAVITARPRRWRPASFGLWWFLIALLPTAVFPVADVENDHRMFMPFVGLALSVVWTARLLLLGGIIDAPDFRRRDAAFTVGAAVALLAALGIGAHTRNQVWRNAETFWYDVTLQSPGNDRGWIGYAQTQIAKGQYQQAYDCLMHANQIRETVTLDSYLGIAASALGRDVEAEAYFRRGLATMEQPFGYETYARWLAQKARWREALENYQWAATLAPTDLDARYGLMKVYEAQLDYENLAKAAQETLRIAPGDPTATKYAGIARKPPDAVKAAEDRASADPTPENYLKLSFLYYRTGRMEDCLRAARQALKLRPGYAEAYNNVAIAYASMGHLDEAIGAVREALRLKPNYQGAANNLAKFESFKINGH